MSEGGAPVPVASYGGTGAWSAAELDAAMLGSSGIRAVVSGDAHHPAPWFTGHQVVLLVDSSERDGAIALLREHGDITPDRSVAPAGT